MFETPSFITFRGFTRNISGPNEIHLKGNRLDLIGKYVLHGQVLIIPVRGRGAANVTISKIRKEILNEIHKN